MGIENEKSKIAVLEKRQPLQKSSLKQVDELKKSIESMEVRSLAMAWVDRSGKIWSFYDNGPNGNDAAVLNLGVDYLSSRIKSGD